MANSFWQREKRRKDSTLLFSTEFSLVEEQGFENRKLKKLFGKGRRRKMSRKDFLKNCKGCKGFSKVV